LRAASVLATLFVMGGITFLIATASAAMAPVPAEVHVSFDAASITRVREGGIADRASARLATADDPVRIASVSKLVVAIGVMKLVEAGTLDLDRDVGDYLGWRLRNPAFPDASVTLRHLLSHTSGLRDDIDYLVPLGTALKDHLAKPGAFFPAHPPGAFFHYTNLNFPVVASVMEKVTGERFDKLMDRLVIAPLKLKGCFNWAMCSDRTVDKAIVLYGTDGQVRRDDLKGRRPFCPVNAPEGACNLTAYVPGDNGALFSPQGGLRISMRDLARIGQALVRNDGSLLSARSVATMTMPIWRFNGKNGDSEGGFYCSYGLAVQQIGSIRGCNDAIFGSGQRRTGHAGEAYGLRSGLCLDMKKRRGVAYFTSVVDDAGPKGKTAYSPAEERLAQER
jgi:CubicO group peptidase (beta-lactamase class C family)